MKKLIICIFILTLTISSLIISVGAVKVQIAPYYTEVESVSVYNGGVEYPLITYKDITYLPLTNGVCDRLWLATGFDAEKGFYIASHSWIPYVEDDSTIFGDEAVNYYGTYYDAVIPEYPIYLNGIRIDSSKEEYPFLNFRGITYMPLTYKYAVEELKFSLSWLGSASGLKLYRADSTGLIDKKTDLTWYISLGKMSDGGFEFKIINNGYTEYTDEFNQTLRYPYSWYDICFFNTKTGMAELIESTGDYNRAIEIFGSGSGPRQRPETDKLTFSGNTVYYDGKVLMTYSPEAGQSDASHIASVYGYEYDIGEKSLIFMWANIAATPSPYTNAQNYLFLKNGDEIVNIPEYDKYHGLYDIYPDGKGGAYVCTAGYHPAGLGRWTSPHSSVYYIDSAGNFTDLTFNYPGVNSLRAVGYHDGKLYVKAMYYGTDKNVYTSYVPFSTVNSGYYVIDADDGHKITKLYSYIDGETFVTPDGEFYCIASFAQKPRIINLVTRVITEIE